MKERLAIEGADAAPRTRDAFRQVIAADLERFRVLVQRAGIRAD
jgi:hypothetical protein